MSINDQEHIEKLIQDFIDKVSEHVDSVRVFVTHPANNGNGDSVSFSQGGGNLFAQQGQIRAWVLRQDQYTIEDTKKEIRNGQ